MVFDSVGALLTERFFDRGEVPLDELSAQQISDASDGKLIRPAWHKRLVAIQKALKKKKLLIVLVPYIPVEGQLVIPEHYTRLRMDLRRLRSAEGGACGRVEAAMLLQVTTVTVDNWRKQKRLVSFKDSAGRNRFPRWQFVEDFRLMPGIEACLNALGGAFEDDKLRFFLDEDPRVKKRPLDLLREGKLKEAVELAFTSRFRRVKETEDSEPGF